MVTFSAEIWLAMAVLTAAGMASILFTLARCFQHERELHDLRLRVVEVRRTYAQRMADMAARERGEAPEAFPIGEARAAGEVAPEPVSKAA